MKQPRKEITFLTCGESGHIKPNYRNKQQMSMAEKRPMKKDGFKVRQLSIPDSDHHLIKTKEMINGTMMTIMLDPAADHRAFIRRFADISSLLTSATAKFA